MSSRNVDTNRRLRSSSWAKHPTFSNLWISRYGAVEDTRTGRFLTEYRRDGAVRVAIWVDGKRIYKKVAHLVLETFVGPRPSSRHHAAHAPDRDLTNNRLNNLRWALPEENEADKKLHGTMRGGGAKKATPKKKVNRIRAEAKNGTSLTKVAKTHGLHRSSVSRIVKGLRRAG